MLCQLLDREVAITVVGVASTAGEAIKNTKDLGPDIVLMHIDMPGLICFDAARTMQAIRPDVKIILLTRPHEQTPAELLAKSRQESP